MSSHDYKIAAEPDLDSHESNQIWIYFVLLGVLLFVTILGLTIMFRFQVDWEKKQKIGLVEKPEATKYIHEHQAYVLGNSGIFKNKKNIPVDQAMSRFILSVRTGQ